MISQSLNKFTFYQCIKCIFYRPGHASKHVLAGMYEYYSYCGMDGAGGMTRYNAQRTHHGAGIIDCPHKPEGYI